MVVFTEDLNEAGSTIPFAEESNIESEVGTMDEPMRMSEEALLKLERAHRTFTDSQRVVYLESGEAFKAAVAYPSAPAVQQFMNTSMDGIVNLFLAQKASSVRANLLENFDHVLFGACKLVIWHLKNRHNVGHLGLVATLMNREAHLYYTSSDTSDVRSLNPAGKQLQATTRGISTWRRIISLFEKEGCFDLLFDMLQGVVPIRENTHGAQGGVGTSERLKTGITLPPPPPPPETDDSPQLFSSPSAELTAEQVRLLLCPFVFARECIGNPRAVEACRLAIAAVSNMTENVLKMQRSADLTLLHKLLKQVLANDPILKHFMRTLSLKTFSSKAFQLRKLGLDLMCKLVMECDPSLGNGIYPDSNVIVSSPGDAAAKELPLSDWLVTNKVLETLFASTESVHPALVGRSQKLLEFMAQSGALARTHIDLMFKSCKGHHDSVRGAVQSLLAEVAVDNKVEPEMASYILESATRLVSERRSDMVFLVTKLMGFGTEISGYKSQLDQADLMVLRALLDLLWRLLETEPVLDSTQRKHLMDHFVAVLRIPKARVLRARYIIHFIDALRKSCTGKADPMRIFSIYEALQKVLTLFSARGSSLNSSSYDSFSNGGIMMDSFQQENQVLEGMNDSYTEEISLLAHSSNENLSLSSSHGALRDQAELISELESRFQILELVVEETKVHRSRSSSSSATSPKNSRDEMLLHMYMLQCRLDFLHFCVSRSSLMLSFDLVHDLWQALEQPVEREVCMVWLREVAVVDTGLFPGLSPMVTRQVFSQLLCGEMEFKHLSEPGFKCFSAFFLDVNRAEDILEGITTNKGPSLSSADRSSSILSTHAAVEDTDAPTQSGQSQAVAEEKSTKGKRGSGKRKKARSSFFSDLFPSIRASWSFHRGSNSKVSASSSTGGHVPSSSAGSPMNASDGLGSVGDTKVLSVKRADVVGLNTLWRIVESAPAGTAERAMDLLLQVQCRIEALGDAALISPSISASSETELPVNGNPEFEDQGRVASGLEHRMRFLDRTFDLLEDSARNSGTSNGSGSDKVQRCVRLITCYLNSFPQSILVEPHASPKGRLLQLSVHHDRVLAFSKRDLGKLVQLHSSKIVSSTGQAPAATRSVCVVCDFDSSSKKHLLWHPEGSVFQLDFALLEQGYSALKKFSENTYRMSPRAHLPKDQLPMQIPHNVDVPQEVIDACAAYAPFTIHVHDRINLAALQMKIISHLLPRGSPSPLSQQTIQLNANIYHKPVKTYSSSAPSNATPHERILIGPQSLLCDVLPDPANAAAVKKTAAAQVVHHVINVSVDEVGPNQTLNEIEDEDHLPSVLITAEGSKYVDSLMKLLDDPQVSAMTRVELWELLLALPTDQTRLKYLTKNPGIVWSKEIQPAGPYLLGSVYKLMIIDRLLGNDRKDASQVATLHQEEEGACNQECIRWRNQFLEAGGFQDIAALLGTILSGQVAEPVPEDWFWYWQRSIALPIIIRIVRFCVHGWLAHTEKENSDESGKLSQNLFDEKARKLIEDTTDLSTLARDLSKLIVVAHRVTCSHSGDAIESSHVNDEQLEERSDEDDDEVSEGDDDDVSESEPFSGGPMDLLGFDGDTDLKRSISVLEKEDSPSEKDEAMLNVLIDGIYTANLVVSTHPDVGHCVMWSQTTDVSTEQEVVSRLQGANSMLDVLYLSRFSIVREMLADLLGGLCEESPENAAVVEAVAKEALVCIPRHCPTSDAFFEFLQERIRAGQFSEQALGPVIVKRLVHYPDLSRHDVRREAKLLAPFSPLLRSQLFKFRQGLPVRKAVNTETPEYKAIRSITLALLDHTLIGFMDVLEQILERNPEVCNDFEQTKPLLDSLFYRFLMAVPNASNKQATAIASLPDARERSYSLLKVLARRNEKCLKWVILAIKSFIAETPVPLRGGRLDWVFKPTDQRRSPTGFVGLVNKGMTCYQNSVLQQLFMAPKLRQWIFNASGLVSLLSGSSNHGVNNVLGSTDESLSWSESVDLDDAEENDSTDLRSDPKNSLLRSLQLTYTYLKESEKKVFDPQAFVNESACLKLSDGHLSQNDAIEFYSRLVDYLEEVSKDKPHCNTLEDLLHVKTCTMNVRNCEGKHRTETETGTPFLTLNVRSGMAGPTLHSLDEALESWFKAEKLSGLECEVCNLKDKEKRFDADQVKCFSKLPPILVVQLQRFDFDYDIMQPTKLNHRVSFEHKLDLSRFTREAVTEQFKTQETAENSLDSSDGEEDVEGKEEPSNSQPKQAETKKAGRVNSKYQLQGVVVHQGSGANFGHYYSFIKDRKHGSWFRFDDERVTPFDIRELEEECFGGYPGGAEGNNGWNSGVGKFKAASKDNNAYLLLYELIQDEDEDLSLASEKKEKEKTCAVAALGTDDFTAEKSVITESLNSDVNTCQLGFATSAKLVVRLKASLRRARLSVYVRRRMLRLAREVWEDNQPTLRHALVLVPSFLDFTLFLLQHTLQESKTKDLKERALLNGLVMKTGLVVFVRATLRVHQQKFRLAAWQSTLCQLLEICSVASPGDLSVVVAYLTSESQQGDTLRPLLLNCVEKSTPEHYVAVLTKAIDLLVKVFSLSSSEIDLKMHMNDSLYQLIDVMFNLIPDGAANCRNMAPFFQVWSCLCRPQLLRSILNNDGIPGRLITLYLQNDVQGQNSGGLARARGVSLDMNQQAFPSVSTPGGFGALLDSVSLLLLGLTSDESYRLAKQGQSVKPDEAYHYIEEDELIAVLGGDLTSSDVTTEIREKLQDVVIENFIGVGQSVPVMRYSRGIPCECDDLLIDEVAWQIAQRDPGPGALILAFKCKGNLEFSNTLLVELVGQLQHNAQSLTISVATCREKAKEICRALHEIASIKDGASAKRSKIFVQECLQAIMGMLNDLKEAKARRDYHRPSRYAQNLYADNKGDEMCEVYIYTIYAIAKILGMTFESCEMVRFWLTEYKEHWKWLPNWLDEHSYEPYLGGNPDVFTRSSTKGRVVRQITRAVRSIHPSLQIKLIEPCKVTVEVSGAGTDFCNGIYKFDGYFMYGESQQIDTVTPKFVKTMPDGRPLNLYRCLIKDKNYTWYISELSSKPGTNNDTDYYSSIAGNPSRMPPIDNWTGCSHGKKPAPQLKIHKEHFTVEENPCDVLQLRRGLPISQTNSQLEVSSPRTADSTLIPDGVEVPSPSWPYGGAPGEISTIHDVDDDDEDDDDDDDDDDTSVRANDDDDGRMDSDSD